jgi:hypothetical protein
MKRIIGMSVLVLALLPVAASAHEHAAHIRSYAMFVHCPDVDTTINAQTGEAAEPEALKAYPMLSLKGEVTQAKMYAMLSHHSEVAAVTYAPWR